MLVRNAALTQWITRSAMAGALWTTCAPAAWSMSPQVPPAYDVRVTGSVVNVRAQPTTQSAVLFQVSRDEILHLVEDAGGWYLVKTPEAKEGYIYGKLVELIELPAQKEVPLTIEPTMVTSLDVTGPSIDKEIRPEPPPMEVARTRSQAEQKRRHGLFKLAGGGAGIVAGAVLMSSSKAAGIGLMGAGGFFVWSGYKERMEGQRQLEWALALNVGKDTKELTYHMSW